MVRFEHAEDIAPLIFASANRLKDYPEYPYHPSTQQVVAMGPPSSRAGAGAAAAAAMAAAAAASTNNGFLSAGGEVSPIHSAISTKQQPSRFQASPLLYPADRIPVSARSKVKEHALRRTHTQSFHSAANATTSEMKENFIPEPKTPGSVIRHTSNNYPSTRLAANPAPAYNGSSLHVRNHTLQVSAALVHSAANTASPVPTTNMTHTASNNLIPGPGATNATNVTTTPITNSGGANVTPNILGDLSAEPQGASSSSSSNSSSSSSTSSLLPDSDDRQHAKPPGMVNESA